MKWTHRKKRAERAVVRMIYDLEKFESNPCEHPDFVLRRSAKSDPFGIEVTQFYESEASARLDHIRGYLFELLGGKRHRHKDDIDALPVEDLTLTDENGTVKAVMKGVMQTLPPVEDHLRMIGERIETKNRTYAGPLGGLTHVNLIVLDKTRRFSPAPPDDVAGALIKATTIWSALATTPFREIFFITDVKENRTVFYPLRKLFLVSELFMFGAAWTAFHTEEATVQSEDEELTLFASFMRSRGVPVMLARGNPEEGLQVILGNVGILVPEEDVTIRTYTDWPLPPTWPPPDRTFSEGFLAFYQTFSGGHVFKSEMVFDVRK